MASSALPQSMRAWQFTSTKGGLPKNLTLNDKTPLPKPKANEHLVRILSVGLNPMDFKPAENQFVHRMVFPKPAIPASDFCGEIVQPAAGSSLQAGQRVLGSSAPADKAMFGAALAEYAAVPANVVTPVPDGVSADEASGVTMAGLTAWTATDGFVKEGDRVFINGGSGGVGTFKIQTAKLKGAYVVVSCSTQNVELCKSLGADEVIDYKKAPVLEQLQALAKATKPFDVAIDLIDNDHNLYWKMHTYSNPGAVYAYAAFGPSLSSFQFILAANLIPSALGGGRRKFAMVVAGLTAEKLAKMVGWIAEGKVRVVVDSKYPFEEAVQAYEKLKTGRAKGKILVLGTA